MINQICQIEKCVGCGLCQNVCPKNTISIRMVDGFWRPVVSDECVECGKCIKLCPANNANSIKGHATPNTVYAAWSKDVEAHHKSSSGGLAFEIAKRIILNGGFVAGIWFNPEKQYVEHRIYEKLDDLHQMQGSRYVSSYKSGIYKKVFEELKNKDGLFIGVPCEVYAMKTFLSNCRGDHIHKLYFIDLLCRGGSSPQCLDEQIHYVSRGKKLSDITFRGGDYDCWFVAYDMNLKTIYKKSQLSDPYFGMFMKHILFQNSCFSCEFAGSNRQGDLTLSDFWGIDPKIEKQSPVSGVNMVMINSKQGLELFEMVKYGLVLFERPSHEAISGNETLRKPTTKPKEYDPFWQSIKKNGFLKTTRRYYKLDCNKHPLRFLYGKTRSLIARVLKGKK